MIREQSKAKALKSQLDQLLGEIAALKTDVANKQKELNSKSNTANNLANEIKKLSGSTELRVTEHALVRYLERVRGFNISDIEKEILTDEVRRCAGVLGGTGTYPADGFSVVMKNGSVVTITN